MFIVTNLLYHLPMPSYWCIHHPIYPHYPTTSVPLCSHTTHRYTHTLTLSLALSLTPFLCIAHISIALSGNPSSCLCPKHDYRSVPNPQMCYSRPASLLFALIPLNFSVSSWVESPLLIVFVAVHAVRIVYVLHIYTTTAAVPFIAAATTLNLINCLQTWTSPYSYHIATHYNSLQLTTTHYNAPFFLSFLFLHRIDCLCWCSTVAESFLFTLLPVVAQTLSISPTIHKSTSPQVHKFQHRGSSSWFKLLAYPIISLYPASSLQKWSFYLRSFILQPFTRQGQNKNKQKQKHQETR